MGITETIEGEELKAFFDDSIVTCYDKGDLPNHAVGLSGTQVPHECMDVNEDNTGDYALVPLQTWYAVILKSSLSGSFEIWTEDTGINMYAGGLVSSNENFVSKRKDTDYPCSINSTRSWFMDVSVAQGGHAKCTTSPTVGLDHVVVSSLSQCDGTKYDIPAGIQCNVVCETGYSGVGDLTCVEDPNDPTVATWSSTFLCAKQTCSLPSSGVNTVSLDSRISGVGPPCNTFTNLNSVCHYYCPQGISPGFIKCVEDANKKMVWQSDVGYIGCDFTIETAHPTAIPTPFPPRQTAAPHTASPPTPTAHPTAHPTAIPTPFPPRQTAAPHTASPPTPTAHPTAHPTAIPTPFPPHETAAPHTASPPTPTAHPTAHPTAIPTPFPPRQTAAPHTASPPTPTAHPTAHPTAIPTPFPPRQTAAPHTASPPTPTAHPTAIPTAIPTPFPPRQTAAPRTASPPTATPTKAPPTQPPRTAPPTTETPRTETPPSTQAPMIAFTLPPVDPITASPGGVIVNPTDAPDVIVNPTATPGGAVNPTATPGGGPNPTDTPGVVVVPDTATPPAPTDPPATEVPKTRVPLIDSIMTTPPVLASNSVVAVTQIVVGRLHTAYPEGSYIDLEQGFLHDALPGHFFSFATLTLLRGDGGERIHFSVTVIGKDPGGNLEKVVQESVSLDPGHSITFKPNVSDDTWFDERSYAVLFNSDAGMGGDFEGKMLLSTRFTPELGVPVADVARLSLDMHALGQLPYLPMSGESSDVDVKSTAMLNCGAVDSDITFTVHPFEGWLRVLASNMTSFVFESPGELTMFTSTCLRGSAIWVSASPLARFSWTDPTRTPTSNAPSAAPLLAPVPSPPLSGTVILSALVQGQLDFNMQSLQNTIPMGLMSLFQLAEGNVTQTHAAYLQSFELTRNAGVGETAEFMLMLHSRDTSVTLWWAQVALSPGETFVGTLNIGYEEQMYFRASPASGSTARMSFGLSMRVHSVLVSADGRGAGVTPTLSVEKALEATDTSLALPGSYSSVHKDFSGTLLCDADANVTVTAVLGSVTAVGTDLIAHTASHTEGKVLVVRCAKGSAVVARCSAPCSLRWDEAVPPAPQNDTSPSSGIPIFVWIASGFGALLVSIIIACLCIRKRNRETVAHSYAEQEMLIEIPGEMISEMPAEMLSEMPGEELEALN